MKKLVALAILALSVSLRSFGAEDVITNSAKVIGKDTYVGARGTAKVSVAALKLIF
jgi:hypothetical protein